MELKLDDEKIKQCIDLCDFKKLKSIEAKSGFYESINANPFFRKAELDEWKKLLDPKIKDKIERNFKYEMVELGYLP